MKNKKFTALRNNIYMLKTLYKLHPKYVIITTILNIINITFSMLYSTYFLGIFVQSIVDRKPIENIIAFVIPMLLIHLLLNFINSFYNVKSKEWLCLLENEMKKAIYEKSMALDIECFENPEFYDDFVFANQNVFNKSIDVLQTFTSFIGFISGFGVMFSFFAQASVSFIIISIAFMFFNLFMGKKIAKKEYEFDESMIPVERKYDYINRVMVMPEYAIEMRITTVFDVIKQILVEATDKHSLNIKLKYKNITILNCISLLFGFGLVTFLVTVISVIKIYYFQTMSVAMYFPLLGAIADFSWRSSVFVGMINGIYKNFLYIDRFKTFLNKQPDIKSKPDAVAVGDFENIQFNNISFKYRNSETEVLSNVNLSIKRGEKVAIVGENGAGKTTLMNLFLRLYDPVEGTILYNGTNIRELDLEGYRNRIGVVYQDFQIYSDSIKNNITMGYTVPEEKIKTVAKTAGIDTKINTLNNGYDSFLSSEVFENGTQLSGGEKQKIAISRIYVQSHDVFIFDEPTSALDPIAEAKLYDQLKNNFQGKTVIFVTHRLSSAKIADHIYFLEKGKVTETGTHDQLMKLNGSYAQMYHMQADYYIDNKEDENEESN